MLTLPRSKPANPYAHAYADFAAQTKDHKLVVIENNGLYKHLRVQAPGTRTWGWDLITWPGHLATSGDIAAGYVFSREPDMLAFFTSSNRKTHYYSDGAPSIDVRYWAEKIIGPHAHALKKYSSEAFLQQVREELEEHHELGLAQDTVRARQIETLEQIRKMRHRTGGEDTSATVAEKLEKHWRGELTDFQLFTLEGLSQGEMDSLEDFDELEAPVAEMEPAQRRQELLENAAQYADSEFEAHQWLQQHEEIFGTDTWEWDLRGWDIHFLYTCYAIELTTRLWKQYQEQLRITHKAKEQP